MTRLGRRSVPPAPEGYVELFEAERLPMLRLATLLVGSASVAEEVIQDAFLELFGRWDDIDNPGGYLRSTVVNRSRRWLRRRTHEVDLLRSDQHRTVAESPTADADLVDLRAALDQLPERQRTVIVLRYFADLPFDEIGELMECSATAARSLAMRARQDMATMLEGEQR